MIRTTTPTLELTFLGNDLEQGHATSQTVSSAHIANRSIQFSQTLIKDLKSSSDQVRLQLHKSCPSTEDIIATEGDIKAVLKDEGTPVFTGYLSTNFSWSVTANGEQALSITLEGVGTRLLNKVYSTASGFFSGTASSAVSSICQACGITVAPEYANILTESVSSTIEAGETCRDLLDQLCYECNSVYWFNALGQLCISRINPSTFGADTIDSEDLYVVNGNAVSVSKTLRQYSNARVSYTELETADNYLVYRNTTGQDATHPYCKLDLPGGNYFDGTEIYTAQQWSEATADAFREPAVIGAVNAASESEKVGSGEILAISNLSPVSTSSTGNISVIFTAKGGADFSMEVHNTSSVAGYLTRLDLYASIVYAKSTSVIRASATGDYSSKMIDEELFWIHDKSLAQAHANLLCQYHRSAGAKYSFYASRDLKLGKVYRLNENAFSGLDVYVLIIGKSFGDTSEIASYSAVGVTSFNLTKDVYYQTEMEGVTAPPQGKPGTTFTPSVSEEGVISWTNDGGQENPPAVSIKGDQGDKGSTGYSQATITLYKRSASAPSRYDGQALTYVFSTGGVTGSTGTWSRTIPSGTEPLYVISASAFSDATTDIVEVSDWTTPAILSENGTKGQDGYTVLTVVLYQRAATTPSKPSSVATYNFDTNTISGVSPWSLTVPDGDSPLWVTSATASTRNTVEDDIEPSEWSNPSLLVRNGATGNGIASITYQYATSQTQTGVKTSYQPTIPTLSETDKYLWQKETITYTEGSPKVEEALIGVYGDKGAPGSNAPNVKFQYSENGTAWSDTPSSSTQYMRVSNDNGSTWSSSYKVKGETGEDGNGISSIVELYYHGTSKPSKPTSEITSTSTSTGVWTLAMPTYVTGNSYYTTSQIKYEDGTFAWSAVQEAVALTSANSNASSAVTTANSAETKVDNLKIGGTNLLLNSGNFKNTSHWLIYAAISEWGVQPDSTLKIVGSGSGSPRLANTTLFPLSSESEEYTISIVFSGSDVVVSGKSSDSLTSFNEQGGQNAGTFTILSTEDFGAYKKRIIRWNTLVKTETRLSSWLWLNVGNNGTSYITNIKVEKGNKATDWSPSPKDSVVSLDVEYYLSTSSSTPTGGSWSTIAPSWVNEKYMWSRQKVTYGDGSSDYSNVTCIAGAKGDKGQDADSWFVSLAMSAYNNGNLAISAYKNNSLATTAVWAKVWYMAVNGSSWSTSSISGVSFTGSYTHSNYTSTKAYKVEIYADSAMTQFLCSNVVSIGDTGATGPQGPKGNSEGTFLGLKDSEPTSGMVLHDTYTLRSTGVTYEWNGSTWVECTDYKKLSTALGAMLQEGLDLQSYNNPNTISWFSTIIAKQIYVNDIFSQVIRMSSTGAIKSDNYEENNGSPVSGYSLTSADGKIKSVGGIFNQMTASGANIEGTFSHPYFRTVNADDGGYLTFTTEFSRLYYSFTQMVNRIYYALGYGNVSATIYLTNYRNASINEFVSFGRDITSLLNSFSTISYITFMLGGGYTSTNLYYKDFDGNDTVYNPHSTEPNAMIWALPSSPVTYYDRYTQPTVFDINYETDGRRVYASSEQLLDGYYNLADTWTTFDSMPLGEFQATGTLLASQGEEYPRSFSTEKTVSSLIKSSSSVIAKTFDGSSYIIASSSDNYVASSSKTEIAIIQNVTIQLGVSGIETLNIMPVESGASIGSQSNPFTAWGAVYN